jgi:antitoxin FitA
MATLTVRKLDDGVKSRLRVRAASNGRSMEEEARKILGQAVGEEDAPKPTNLADAIAAIFDPLGGVELDIPPRGPGRPPPDFSGPEYDR